MARILVIDDNPHVCSLVQKALEGVGYEVVTATNGREGLQRFRLQPADLVITDLCMPEQDGLETIERLIRQYASAKVIAMSGASGTETSLQTAELLGANRIIKKPFELEELFSLVRAELSDQEGEALKKPA